MATKKNFFWGFYVFRLFAYAILCSIVVLHWSAQHVAHAFDYVLLGVFIVWPHLSLIIQNKLNYDKKLENRFQFADYFFCGFTVGLTHFALVPTMVLIGMGFISTISFKLKSRFLFWLIWFAVGVMFSATMCGFEINLESSLKMNFISFLGLLFYILLFSINVNKSAHTLISNRKELRESNELIQSQKEKLELKNVEIERINEDIVSSLQYASLIQTSLLSDDSELEESIKDSFILNKPKDIVSGDFFWMHKEKDDLILALGDCTGHGIPGLVMSVIGDSSLNEIVKKKKNTCPKTVLELLDESITQTLNQREGDNWDGIDISIIRLNQNSNLLEFAGARSSICLLNKSGDFTRIRGSIFSVGGEAVRVRKSFLKHSINLSEFQSFYMYSDGFSDQFGGKDIKKMTFKRFNEKLIENMYLPMKEQGEILALYLEHWKKEQPQTDDILVVGCRI